MRFNTLKYKRIIGTVILFSYLALFFANIVHHHSIKLNPENSFKVLPKNNFDSSNHFSIHSEFNCPFHSYFNSLHNYLLLKLNFKIYNSPQILQNKFYSDFVKSEFYYASNPLRAPPVIFS